MMRFKLKGKLATYYIGPHEVVERISRVTYRLALPESIRQIHNVFHVSLLYKCLDKPFQVVSFKDMELEDNLVYEDYPMQIMDRQIKTLKH